MKRLTILLVAALALLWLAGDAKAQCCSGGCCAAPPAFYAPAPMYTVYRPMPVGPVFYQAPPVYFAPQAPVFWGCYGGCCGGRRCR